MVSFPRISALEHVARSRVPAEFSRGRLPSSPGQFPQRDPANLGRVPDRALVPLVPQRHHHPPRHDAQRRC